MSYATAFATSICAWWAASASAGVNRWAQRWLPRDTLAAALAHDAMSSICERLNTTPRTGLGSRTPAEAFRAEMRRIT